MRLAILALSAAAISGCSWMGSGHHAPVQNGCYPAAGAGYGFQQVGYQQSHGFSQGQACAGGLYGVQSAGVGYNSQGYGAQGYAIQGYQGAAMPGYNAGYASAGATAGYGAAGYGANGYGAGGTAYASSATTLSAAAPYGAAVSGQYGQVPGLQASGVQTVVGAPIYVPQPYPAPQLRGSACCGGSVGGGAAFVGGAMPFGVEIFGGTEFDASGQLFTKKSDGPPDGDFTQNIRVGEIDAIGYDDAFGATKTIGGALTYDVSPNTTLIGSVAHGNAEGQTVEGYTTVQPGTWSGTTFTPTTGSTARALDGTFTDLETTTLEAGLRHYVGHPSKLRPYIGATGGFVHNGDVQFTQTYSDDGTYYGEREFISSGWNPTASATLGAEMALGPRAAIGVESGIRWRDDMKTAAPSEDRLTIPVTLRGRLSF